MRYVVESTSARHFWCVKDRVTGERVAVFFSRTWARRFRDWINALHPEPAA